MKFLDAKQWSKKTDVYGIGIPKGVFYFIFGIIGATLILWAAGFAYRSGMGDFNGIGTVSRGSMPSLGYGGTTGGWGGAMTDEAAVAPMPPGVPAYDGSYGYGKAMIPNPYPYPGGQASGEDAEEYEVKEYSAGIKVSESEGVCNEFAALKTRTDVIFSYANEREEGCEFRFKTPKDEASAILAMIEAYNPEYLDGQTSTIKPQLDSITSEEEILKGRLEAIDATLREAEETYAELARLAAQAQDAEALARVISSKLAFIQQMTNERLAINDTLARLARSKSEETDRLDYAFFNVSVYEQKIFDPEQFFDDWRMAARQFVSEANQLLIGLSLGLLLHLIVGLQFALYLFLIVIIAKYGWRAIRSIWNK